jgi:hypothetical protein
MDTIGALVVVIIVSAGYSLGVMWALDYLFPALNIEYTWKTYFAVFILVGLFTHIGGK